MTELNGLHLAYRGFVAGLAGAYVWVATAMVLSLPAGEPLEPLRLLGSLGPGGWGASVQHSFVLGLGISQVAGAGIGLAFAYFVARFFTVRATLALAAVCVAVLAWAFLGSRLAMTLGLDPRSIATSAGLLFATIAYGCVLGWSVPVRGEVTRYAGSPST